MSSTADRMDTPCRVGQQGVSILNGPYMNVSGLCVCVCVCVCLCVCCACACVCVCTCSVSPSHSVPVQGEAELHVSPLRLHLLHPLLQTVLLAGMSTNLFQP